MTRPRETRILVVEDCDSTRRCIRACIERVGGIDSVVEVSDLMQAKTATDLLTPDIAIIDLVIRGGSGLEVVTYLNQTCPACKIIVWTAHTSPLKRKESTDRGADHFLDKMTDLNRLIELLTTYAAPESRWTGDAFSS